MKQIFLEVASHAIQFKRTDEGLELIYEQFKDEGFPFAVIRHFIFDAFATYHGESYFEFCLKKLTEDCTPKFH